MSSDMIDYLMGQPDGANYVVLYQMLCLKTINTGGRLAFQIGDMIIPYDVEKIQRECKWFSLATVRVALEVYKQIGLIYEDKDGVLVLANYSDIVGSETDYSAQKRLQRENRRRQLPPKCADSNEDKPDSFRASVLRGMMHFMELYHGEFSEERLIRALRSVHPMEIYRSGMDNPAKLPGWKKYVFPIYMAYNGKCRKDALPMKF